MSVEAVLESVVSMHESRQGKFRYLPEERANTEIMIAVNLDFVHTDSIKSFSKHVL